MRTVYLVRFFHREGWQTYEEYGPTMEDVAVQRTKELSVPFGNAEVRTLMKPDNTPLEFAHVARLRIYKSGELDTDLIQRALL